MWAAIASFVLGLLGKMLGSRGAPNDPTAVDLAASNAAAQTELTAQENAHATLARDAADRTDADRRVMRDSQGPGGLDADSAGHWRD